MYEEEEKAENKEQMLRNEEATLFARTVIHPVTGQSCSPDYCHAGGVGCRGARVPECYKWHPYDIMLIQPGSGSSNNFPIILVLLIEFEHK